MALNNEFKVKNDLNTLGRILSGGTDLTTIFSPSNTSWTLSATNGTFGVAGGDTVQFQGSNGVDVRVATGTDTVRVSGIDATASVKGVASFHADNFLVTNGVVTVKDGGILNAELAGSITDDKLSTISTALKVSNSATTATSANTNNAIVARGASGEFSSGDITSSSTVQAVTVNATTGFRLNNGATSGNVLRGNGTNFVSSAIQVSDVPTLNQNTTGSAATLTTGRSLWGQNFTGSANVSGSLTGVGNIIGSGTITLSAGSGNNNINLTPSGTGLVTATGNLSASGTVTGNNIDVKNILSVGAVQVRTVGTSNVFLGSATTGRDDATGNHNFVFGLNAGSALTVGGYNNFLGIGAGKSNNSGSSNNFLGGLAGCSNTTGCNNNFLGRLAGYSNTTGGSNNFFGNRAGCSNTGGCSNNFLGHYAGHGNTEGCNNNFFGNVAGYSNTTGGSNNFFGNRAGRGNTEGCSNNFLGHYAGCSNTYGSSNNFLGRLAGCSNTTGSHNNIFGYCAGRFNTIGVSNNFLGQEAGCYNSTGSSNNFLGPAAGLQNSTGSFNNFFGVGAGITNATGSNNTIIGNAADVSTSSLSGVIVLGTGAIATESNQIVLSTANVSFRNIGDTFQIGTPSLTDNLTVFGAVSSTGIVNTNTGFRISNAATSGNVLRGNGTNFVSSAIQVSDVPTLNQNTTGSAATLTTGRSLWGQNFTGSANVSGSLTGVGNITGSGAITIQPFATNQDISLTTSGTGEVNIAKVDIDSGTIDGVSIGTASAVTQLIVDEIEIDSNIVRLKSGSSAAALQINTTSGTTPIIFNGNSAGNNAIISSGIGGDLILGTNLNDAARARLTLDDATNGNITFGLNGTGSVVIPRADINAGTIDDTAIGASTASTGRFTQVVVDNITIDGNTISSTDVNGNINLTPNGTGEVNITKVDIDAGTIDGTAIGASTASTGRFTTLETSGNVIINGNLTISGSATQIETSNLVISDPIIFLGEGNLADTVDIGFTAAYNHGQPIPRHTGLIRDSFTQQWTLFSNLSTEVLSAVQIPLDNPSLQIDTLRANIIGTVTGNLSGMASQIADGSVSTNKIVNDAVTYAKIQNVSATDKILGRSTAGAGVVEEITCTLAGRNLLDDASASAQRTTLGVGTTDSVTFGEVIVNNGTISVLNDVFNASSSNNTHTLTTFAKANYNSAKFTVQIKQGNNRCLFEVLTTNDNGTWNGTVYGLVGADLLDNIDITTVNTTVDLAFTFKGTATARTMTVYAQAISD